MEKEKDGVWRTIRGRRVFIRSGESLGSAMSRSGKFKREDIREGKRELSASDRMQQRFNAKNSRKREKLTNKIRKNDSKEAVNKTHIFENARSKNSSQRTIKNYYKYSDEDRRQVRHEELQKKLADYKENTMSKNIGGWTIKQEDDMYKQGRQARESIYQQEQKEKSRKAIADYKAKKQSNNKIETSSERQEYEKIKNKYGRGSKEERKAYFSLSNEERGKMFNEQMDKRLAKIKEKEQSNNKVNDREFKASMGEVDIPDDFEAQFNDYARKRDSEQSNNKVETERELYNRAKNNPESIDPMTENSTDWEALEKKYGKEEKIKKYVEKKKGKSDKNSWLPKETEIKEQGKSNRKEVSENIQAHILSYYDKPEDFIQQMDVFSNLPTNWHRGEEIAKGGSYLIYNGDMADFLDKLKINPKGKKFSEDKAFNTYTSLIGRESAKLYDRIKKHQADTINNYKKKKGK